MEHHLDFFLLQLSQSLFRVQEDKYIPTATVRKSAEDFYGATCIMEPGLPSTGARSMKTDIKEP